MVTRCATQISMKRGAPGTDWKGSVKVLRADGSSGGSIPGCGPVDDKEEIGSRIADITKFLISEVKNVTFSQDVIVISIESPELTDLTIIDLPGIIRTATHGQRDTVVKEVNAIIDKYLFQEHTICVAVVPANVDIATNEILERAQKCDPEGNRTIGVVTKPDLVDKGTEDGVCRLVNNDIKPLKLGYVLVKNRGQADLDSGCSLLDAQKEATAYLTNHPVYGRLGPKQVGVDTLTSKLSVTLVDRIKVLMPEMLGTVDTQLKETKTQLLELGPKPPTTKDEKVAFVVTTVGSYVDLLEDSLKGINTKEPLSVDDSIRICAISVDLYSVLKSAVNNLKPAFDTEKYYVMLEKVIKKSRGEELTGFLSFQIFRQLVSQFVMEWKKPALECIEKVVSTCLSSEHELVRHVCSSYVHCGNSLSHVFSEVLESLHVKLLEDFASLIGKKQLVPFTQNHYYMDTVNKMRADKIKLRLAEKLKSIGTGMPPVIPAVMDASGKRELSPAYFAKYQVNMESEMLAEQIAGWIMAGIGNKSNERQEAEMMAEFLEAYWKVASKRFLDAVPQLIIDELLHELGKEVHKAAMKQCFSEEDGLFDVPSSELEKRERLEQKVERLTKARKAIHNLM